MIIDAHQHFWQPERGDYGWLTPELTQFYRDFMPDDLAPHLSRGGIDGTILVQAAPTVAETEFLLEIAESTPFVLGVVGWTDFAAPSAATDISGLAKHPKLVGLRPMIQDIADDTWMLRPELTPAFEAIIDCDLTFDALVRPQHLPHLRALLSRHPKLRVVIDHGAKPNIAEARFDSWANDMEAIAQDTTAYCKLSGLLNEAGTDWTNDDIVPYVTHLLAHFGPQRLVWGSDWPILTLMASYENWHEMAVSFIQNATDRDLIFGANALDLYRRVQK
ncbi:amidohydrolase family protein [Pacificibacter marinus]|uniref:amidohydrolase family protein n=1 Tax=Pacificibacter marinus TaxID=658057 RepID=UPI001C065651|nr:amidohydrolase family protein [Pacificibacter marinus]MBU2867400.1 amidohydrolase family protein [Pacificibacter marinus]